MGEWKKELKKYNSISICNSYYGGITAIMTNKEGYRSTLINPKDISRAEINVRIWELTYFYEGEKYTTKVHPGNVFYHSTGQVIKLSDLNEWVSL